MAGLDGRARPAAEHGAAGPPPGTVAAARRKHGPAGCRPAVAGRARRQVDRPGDRMSAAGAARSPTIWPPRPAPRPTRSSIVCSDRIDHFAADDRAGPTKSIRRTGQSHFADRSTSPGTRATAVDGVRAVIWATGYRRRVPWLQVPVLDAAGEIRQFAGRTPAPGLFVIGMRWQTRRNSTFIDGVRHDAALVVDHLINGALAGTGKESIMKPNLGRHRRRSPGRRSRHRDAAGPRRSAGAVRRPSAGRAATRCPPTR